MYFSVGSEEIFANYLRFLRQDPALPDQEPSFNALKAAYGRIIAEKNPLKEEKFTEDTPYRVVDSVSEARLLMQVYCNDSMLDDMDQGAVIVDRFDVKLLEKVKSYTDQLAVILERDYALRAVFDLTINYVFVMPSEIASGGSSSALPGVIWINPRDSWDDLDRQELLVHELTHNLLFVDEIVHGFFDYGPMPKKENWTYSAVLAKKRPLDKAFHSAVVAAEVLLYRHTFKQHPDNPGAHPPTDLLLRQTQTSLDECRASSLLLPRARFLLDACQEKLTTAYQLDTVCYA